MFSKCVIYLLFSATLWDVALEKRRQAIASSETTGIFLMWNFIICVILYFISTWKLTLYIYFLLIQNLKEKP